jgi:O-antigen/teichoic acid export membrane protein
MTFLFRPDYTASAPILMVLSVAFLIWFGPPYGVVFVSMGRQRINFYVSATCAAANVGLNFIFIPMYGPIAAAATTLATYTLMKAMYLYFCRRHLGSTFINRRYATVLLLCVALAAGLRATGMHVLAAGATFSVIYAIGSYLVILTASEKQLCKRLLGILKGEEAPA